MKSKQAVGLVGALNNSNSGICERAIDILARVKKGYDGSLGSFDRVSEMVELMLCGLIGGS